MAMADQLPNGWNSASLKDIAELNPRHPKNLDDAAAVTFVPMAALSETKWSFRYSEEQPLGKVRQGYTHFAEGDVLFAKITPCMENGKAGLAIAHCLTLNVTQGGFKKGTLTHNSMLPNIAFSRREKYESTIQTRVSGNGLFAV
jgi:type I restriction enzyme, S subunit